jgi:hypothetical protein
VEQLFKSPEERLSSFLAASPVTSATTYASENNGLISLCKNVIQDINLGPA